VSVNNKVHRISISSNDDLQIYWAEVEEEDKEEDERISLKEFSKDNLCVSLFFIHEHEYFFQRIKAYSSTFGFLSPQSFLKPAQLSFRVLRI